MSKIVKMGIKTSLLLLGMMASLFCAGLAASEVEDRLNALESTVLDLRLSSARRNIYWSGDMTNSCHSFSVDGMSNDPASRHVKVLYHRTRLNATSELGSKLNIYASAAAHFTANSTLFFPNPVVDSGINNNSGIFLRLERAYFDYRLIEDFQLFRSGVYPLCLVLLIT